MLKALLAVLLLAAPPLARAAHEESETPAFEDPPTSSTETASGSEATTTSTTGGDFAPIEGPAPQTAAPAGGISHAAKPPVRAPAPAHVPVAQNGGGAVRSTPEPEGPTYSCAVPNRQGTVEQVLKRPGMAEALTRLCRHQTDWTFLDAALDELRKTDRRWGYWCRRGNCGDPSHDVLAYYCGPGLAWEGADNAAGVDFIVASCYDPGDGADPRIGWGVFEKGNPVGTRAWTGRGRLKP